LPGPKNDDRDKLPSDGEQLLNVDQHNPASLIISVAPSSW
jgi:hypothetical protein